MENQIVLYSRMMSLILTDYELIISSAWTLLGMRFASASNTDLQTIPAAKYQSPTFRELDVPQIPKFWSFLETIFKQTFSSGKKNRHITF